ncbi:MAG: hypothetical protein U1E36_08515 [Rickettsiales bacterium]
MFGVDWNGDLVFGYEQTAEKLAIAVVNEEVELNGEQKAKAEVILKAACGAYIVAYRHNSQKSCGDQVYSALLEEGYTPHQSARMTYQIAKAALGEYVTNINSNSGIKKTEFSSMLLQTIFEANIMTHQEIEKSLANDFRMIASSLREKYEVYVHRHEMVHKEGGDIDHWAEEFENDIFEACVRCAKTFNIQAVLPNYLNIKVADAEKDNSFLRRHKVKRAGREVVKAESQKLINECHDMLLNHFKIGMPEEQARALSTDIIDSVYNIASEKTFGHKNLIRPSVHAR